MSLVRLLLLPHDLHLNPHTGKCKVSEDACSVDPKPPRHMSMGEEILVESAMLGNWGHFFAAAMPIPASGPYPGSGEEVSGKEIDMFD
jgi:hypothetical protein